MQESVPVYNSSLINFFILSDNKTGVVVITSENLRFTDELFELQHGFSLLEDKGVQKVSMIQIIYLILKHENMILI